MAAARPPRCPACGAAGSGGGRTTLHGHGLRIRWLVGALELGGAPTVVEVLMRRYACQACGAVITVGPRGLVPRLTYTLAVVALALWLWAVLGRTDAEVRGVVCPRPVEGLSRPERWTTLRRWVAQLSARDLNETWRDAARRVARGFWSQGPPDACDLDRVVAGAQLHI